MLVYIAAPYSLGNVDENVRNSILAADRLMDLGHEPYNPLLSHFHHLVRPRPYEQWMQLDLAIIRKCDCLLRLPGESKGADREVRYAVEIGKPVYDTIEEIPNE